MNLSFAAESVPLQETSEGVVRVGGTRVTLDAVVCAFNSGATAEEIVQQYPSMNLADVYQVIGYYLRRRAEVDAYLRLRTVQGNRARQENESRFDPEGTRERLLARRTPPHG